MIDKKNILNGSNVRDYSKIYIFLVKNKFITLGKNSAKRHLQ